MNIYNLAECLLNGRRKKEELMKGTNETNKNNNKQAEMESKRNGNDKEIFEIFNIYCKFIGEFCAQANKLQSNLP